MNHADRHDRSPAIAELLDDAHSAHVDVETASRHLWMIHKEADRLRAEAPLVTAPPAITESLSLRRHVPRAAVPLLVAVMLMSSSGMALAASQGSLPGDVLYPVKRGTEQAQLVFARDPDTRAQLQLAFARTRLDEIRLIGNSRPQHVAALVTAITVSLSEVEQSAPDSAPASQRLREETTQEIASLSLTGSVGAAVDQAMTAAPAPSVPDTTGPSDASTSTPTPVPMAPGSAAAVATATTDVTVSPNALPSASAATEPVASADPSIRPESSESTGDSPAAPAWPSASPSASPSTSGSASPSPSPTPTSTEGEGTVVTPRPHASGEGGTSRSDDEPSTDESSTPEDEPQTGADESASDMPMTIFVRPGD